MKYIQIQTTFKTRDEAIKFSSIILDQRLVADGQISEIESTYNFEGKRYIHKEYLLTMKTRAELYGECEKFIKQHHSYKVPQIVATELKYGNKDYFDWIDENTKRP